MLEPACTSTLDELTATIKKELVETAILTETLNESINQKSIVIGEALTQAKAMLPHGNFTAWLADNFNMTTRTAQNYMKVANYFGADNFKNENVFAFQPAAMLELTKLPLSDVQKFLDANTDKPLENLSVRKLSQTIKAWRTENALTIDTSAELTAASSSSVAITTAQPKVKHLQLVMFQPAPPAAPLWLIPSMLQDTADNSGFSIKIDFSRQAKFCADEILITRQSCFGFHFQAIAADAVIITVPLTFTTVDGTAKKFKSALWYSGNNYRDFVKSFGYFGAALYPPTSKIFDKKINPV